MHRLFGRKKEEVPEDVPTLADAAGSMQKTDEDLDKKITAINRDLFKLNQQIKRSTGATQQRYKKQAMTLLSRRRQYEKQKDVNANTLFNLDQVAFQLSSVKGTQAALSAMQTANIALKEETKKLDLDKVEDMQEDLEEMFEDMNEITEVMGRNVNGNEFIDYDELDAELACLEDELDLDEAGPTELPSYLMPEAPKEVPVDTTAEAPATEEAAPQAEQLDAYGLPTK